MPKFNVYEASSDPFDPSKVDDPDDTIEAPDADKAARMYADKHHCYEDCALYLNVPGTKEWWEIELVQIWETDMFHPTTLEEISRPKSLEATPQGTQST